MLVAAQRCHGGTLSPAQMELFVYRFKDSIIRLDHFVKPNIVKFEVIVGTETRRFTLHHCA